MKAFLYVGVGGFLGANLRFFVCDWAAKKWGDQLPYGTFLVNILGSFIIGFLVMLIAEQFDMAPHMKELMITGFLGAFTTFSSFMFDAVLMLSKGTIEQSLFYMLGSLLVGFLAVLAGSALGGHLAGIPIKG